MNEGEAEEALLAIANPPQWQEFPVNQGFYPGRVQHSLEVDEKYTYVVRPGRYPAQSEALLFGEVDADGFQAPSYCPFEFEDDESAKAACERHFATGKWF